jgi:hypothetical protein
LPTSFSNLYPGMSGVPDGRGVGLEISREADIGDARGQPRLPSRDSSDNRTSARRCRAMDDIRTNLLALHAELAACRACPAVAGTPVQQRRSPPAFCWSGKHPVRARRGSGDPSPGRRERRSSAGSPRCSARTRPRCGRRCTSRR